MRMMKIAGGMLAVVLAVSFAGAGVAHAAKAKKKGPGMCGTYMYWKAGKCMDARLKK